MGSVLLLATQWKQSRRSLDEGAPDNGLIRDYAIGPGNFDHEILFRINEPWHLSLNDDKVLIETIKSLIEQDPD